jgi:hypothetical protein
MDPGQLSMVADKFPWVFSDALLNACGKEAQLCRRQRVITPFRLGLARTATCASPRVDTLAAFHRGFHALFATTMTDNAFSNPLATPHCAPCMGTMASRLSGDMTLKVLGGEKGRACAAFRHMVMQDGRSCALHDAWRAVLPGRVKGITPAAGARHTTMDWRCAAPTTVVLTPDTARAQPFFPEPAARRARLLLADRGSLDLYSRRRVQAEGGSCIRRAKAGLHPQVVEAWRADGLRLRALRTKPRKVLHATRPTRHRVALVVVGQVEEHPLRLRRRISGNRPTQACCYVWTNLPAKRSHLDLISRAYQGRWQVE